MIRLERQRELKTIPAAFRGEKRIEKMLTLLAAGGGTPTFDSKYWTKAKKQLRAESYGKCAYCEAPTAVVAHADVEHFRPKGVYWWLAYCYDNYLFACQICNQSFKGDRFPVDDENARMAPPALDAAATDAQKHEYVRVLAPDPCDPVAGRDWDEFQAACRAERYHLLNPYLDEPADQFAWEPDEVLRQVKVRPKSPASRHHYEAAECCFGLNRPELLAERWKVYKMLETLHDAYPQIRKPALKAKIELQLAEMISPSGWFAGMCRYFVREVWEMPITPAPVAAPIPAPAPAPAPVAPPAPPRRPRKAARVRS
jgi:uncharacterized protein (TIGR02646 family)